MCRGSGTQRVVRLLRRCVPVLDRRRPPAPAGCALAVCANTVNPQCPIGPAAIPPCLAQLRAQGFQVVRQDGPIMVLHRA
ncbi:hypothetical protein [Streptacidiphilus sp. EB129]|uniref:hypothetical protein n=1 Tax=Streptacidiphilus sp. EB129 TaxID=3156262 RepID=UPI003514AF6C